MKLINLTDADILVQTPDGRIIIPASGTVARLVNREKGVGHVYMSTYDGRWVGVPVALRIREGLANLPDLPRRSLLDTLYIVSELVLETVGQNRPDLIAPDTGPTAIRDEQGRILAVTRFVKIAQD